MNRVRSNTQSAFGRLDGFDSRGAPLDGPFDIPDADLKLEQQEQLDYWAAFRRGLYDERRWIVQHERGLRRPIYELFTVPKRRSWALEDQRPSWTPGDQGPQPDPRDPTRPRMVQVDQRPPATMRYHTIEALQNPEKLRRADGEIMRGENPIMTALQPLGFRFKKTLGQGGGGIAILVDLLDENGQAEEWVVKAPLEDNDLKREARNMRRMVGARHMVQRKFIRVRGRNLPADPIALNSNGRDSIIGMELLKHGSLDALLRKVSRQNLKLRDDELWMIFHCLFRACVALARPRTWSGGLNPERDPIPLLDEAIPPIGPDYHATLRSMVIWCMMHDPAKRPDFRQLEDVIVGNIRSFQRDGDPNTEGRTSIRDILTTPTSPAAPSTPRAGPARPTASSLGIEEIEDPAAWILGPEIAAGIQHVRWSSSGWREVDAGIEGAGGGAGGNQPVVIGVRPQRSNLRAAVRNAFRSRGDGGGGGGGLRNLAQRAGRGIRRVFRGAVRRVSGSVGPHRRTQVGTATVSRPAAQQADGGRGTMTNLQFAMAAMGVVYPGNVAWARRGQRGGDNRGPPAP
ncbi:hypothetical protein KVR01_013517 [Diaporthe batatas]|uniref:uncharacterized protein n=1 Tax=Diaporthe batatas TaxID=748121 RepID=UPI001D040171|nr:uncharacterized protein KVR01_013517 [Diaporthe batatas]KAG8156566.1 hypothetical protein KVR01_013517 [Diaporthe batatas]